MPPSPRPAPSRATTASAPAPRSWPAGAVFAAILLATLLAYFPALDGDFLWDDAGHVTRPDLQSLPGLTRIWTEVGATQQYYPLLHSAFWLEHQVWGDHPAGYHLVNVLWHALSATLLVVLLRRIALPGALLAGFVFALHPVAVESVAWISEQKNTLSTVLYLAAALAWLRFETDRRPARYAVATLWFVAALLTKSVTATLPAALLVLAWWRRGRLDWHADVAPLLPWLALGVAAGLGTAWLEATQIGAAGAEFSLSPIERVLLAGRVAWFYLGTLLWPAGLAFFYPRWTIDAGVAWQWLFPLATLAVLAAAWGWRRRDRGPLAVLLLYGGTLVPVLGFVNVYPFVFSYVADHFQYLASLAMLSFLAATATAGLVRMRWPGWSGATAATGLVLVLGGLTWQQSGQYRDLLTLYQSTVQRSPDSWVAQLNLGTTLDDAGRSDEALRHVRRALELKPDHPETLNSLGNVLNRLGRPDEARPLLERAITLQPRFAAAHNTLGAALMALREPEAGMAAFRRALDLKPALTEARTNLGWALANAGRFTEAIGEFETARRAQPASADLEVKWGLTLARQARVTEALPHFQAAVALRPENPDTRHLYGRALLEAGQSSAAAEQFAEALRVAPSHPGARAGLDQIRGTSAPSR